MNGNDQVFPQDILHRNSWGDLESPSHQENGIDLRTYLAAHAPIEPLSFDYSSPGSTRSAAELRAVVAVAWADALIAELNKKPK